MKRAFILYSFFLYSAFACAQDIKVHAAFDSARILIGDQVHFTVTVEKPEGTNLLFPILRDSLVSHIEILRSPSVDSVKTAGGRIRITHRYLITSFYSGFYQVAPQYAEMSTKSGIKRFYSDYSRLAVGRVRITPPDSSARIFDIVKPYRAPVTAGEILPWVLAAIVAGALVWFVVRYIRKLRRNRSGGLQSLPNPDPAHVIALRDLEKLREQKLWQQGHTKLYYTRLTEIVRQYLENRYFIQSLELTTAETLSLLKKTGFREDGLFNKLKTLLTTADLVKFAKYDPLPADNDLFYEQAWDFVSLTRLVEDTSSPVPETEKKGGDV